MIYVSSACIKKNKISAIVKQLAEHGIKNIELSGGTDYYSELINDLEALKNIYHLNYVCHAYFPPPKVPFVVNLASCNDKIYQQSIKHYVQCVEMLKYLQINVLSIHAGFLVEIYTDEIGKKLNCCTIYDEKKVYERFCMAYEYIAKLCAENNISLYLENNVLSAENYQEFRNQNYMMMTDFTSILKMKGQLRFNLLLDLGHLYVSCKTLGLDYSKECENLKKYTKWIHISENNGITDEHKPLVENSEILKAFYKLYHSSIHTTLETSGNIDDILASIKLLEIVDFKE